MINNTHLESKEFDSSCFNLLNKVYYHALCALFLRYDLNFESILQLQGGFSIHTKHLLILATEIVKSLHKLNPEFMWNCFVLKTIKYNLRAKFMLKLPSTKTHS